MDMFPIVEGIGGESINIMFHLGKDTTHMFFNQRQFFFSNLAFQLLPQGEFPKFSEMFHHKSVVLIGRNLRLIHYYCRLWQGITLTIKLSRKKEHPRIAKAQMRA